MELAYREYGSGRPLVILHGLFGQGDNWTSLAKQFAEAGFRVFTLDLRNHGLSPQSSEWDYPLMAADLKQFIEQHALQEPVLIGHSMGGKVLLFFELLYPGIAGKLVIADIAARYYEPHHQSILAALNAVDFDQHRGRKEAEAVLSQGISDFGTRQFLLKNLYWKTNDRLAWRFNLPVISEKINSVGVAVPPFVSATPCLVLRGDRSDYIRDEDLQDFKKRFPSMQAQSLSNAGHWLHAEQPRAFLEAVLGFITA